MSDEPTERDVDMVADWLGALPESANHFDYTDEATTMITADVESLARAVLASDWYAERIAEARREGAREALEQAVDTWQFKDWSNVLLPKPEPPAVPVIAYSNSVLDWLRDRAAALRSEGT